MAQLQWCHQRTGPPAAASAPHTSAAGAGRLPRRPPRPARAAASNGNGGPSLAAKPSRDLNGNGKAPAAPRAAASAPAPPAPAPVQKASYPPAPMPAGPAPESPDSPVCVPRVSVKSLGGLRRAPLSGGVKTATSRYDLPPPAVAVRNLVEQAHFAHLCTRMSGMHHRRAGYPFGTLVDFAADGAGMPVLCLSPLAIHARNLEEDARCSVVVQMPGWTGLANARVTIFGDMHALPQAMQATARDMFLAKQGTRDKPPVSGNFSFHRMHRVTDIYFVGGFGTVQWIDPEEYLAAAPDAIATNDQQRTLAELNEAFAGELAAHLDPEAPADEALLISIDALGADVRLRFGSGRYDVERIGFGRRVETAAEARGAIRMALECERM